MALVLEEDCNFIEITEANIEDFSKFDCNHSDLNDFFSNDCLDYSNQLFGKSYCFVLKEDRNTIICAFTVSNESIKAKQLENVTRNRITRTISNSKRFHNYPAVLIGRLGVNINYHNQKIGKQLMDFIKSWFCISNKTGCRFLVVDSYNEDRPLRYYRGNDFKEIFKDEKLEKKYVGVNESEVLRTRLLYFDLIQISKERNN